MGERNRAIFSLREFFQPIYNFFANLEIHPNVIKKALLASWLYMCFDFKFAEKLKLNIFETKNESSFIIDLLSQRDAGKTGRQTYRQADRQTDRKIKACYWRNNKTKYLTLTKSKIAIQKCESNRAASRITDSIESNHVVVRARRRCDESESALLRRRRRQGRRQGHEKDEEGTVFNWLRNLIILQ